MWFYERLHARTTTFPPGENPSALALAHNEGKRMAWLMFVENLKEDDMELRALYDRHKAERLKEAEENWDE